MAPQLQATAHARARAVRRRRSARRPATTAPRRPAGDLRLPREPACREAERARISEVLLRILNGSLFELLNLARENAGAAAAARRRGDAGLHDAGGAVAVGQLLLPGAGAAASWPTSSRCRPACSRWRARPGKTLVYLGAVLLIVGVFAMLYIRERRLWIWIAPGGRRADTRLHHRAVHHPPHAGRRRRVRAAEAGDPRQPATRRDRMNTHRRHEHHHARARPPRLLRRPHALRLAVRRAGDRRRRGYAFQRYARRRWTATRRRSWSARCRRSSRSAGSGAAAHADAWASAPPRCWRSRSTAAPPTASAPTWRRPTTCSC